MDIRQGGLKERLITAKIRIQTYLDEQLDCLEELEQPDLTFDPKGPIKVLNRWKASSTASVIGW
jgi:hypothetical protein